jgi:glycosyltransferase involved in cell wall biosynthesis
MPGRPAVSIIIPTRGRPRYLDVALESVAPQAARVGAEVVVVSDGPNELTASVAERHGARFLALPEPRGLNAVRNAGIEAATGDLLVFVDDDVRAPDGWLGALLAGARAAPEREVFGGPIRPRLEAAPRHCGREPAPITALFAGGQDRDIPRAWGTNMAVRRSAFDRVGRFDEALSGRGDEEEWEQRYTSAGGRIRYIAAAGLDHRRNRTDSRLRVLTRQAYEQGRQSRRHDIRSGNPRTIAQETRILVGCAWHLIRHRCAYGIVMGARAAGSLREALAQRQSRWT